VRRHPPLAGRRRLAERIWARRLLWFVWPGAALSFCTVIGYHWLPFLRDLHSNLAVIAVMFCGNDGVRLARFVRLTPAEIDATHAADLEAKHWSTVGFRAV
jgi:hypothetical protein